MSPPARGAWIGTYGLRLRPCCCTPRPARGAWRGWKDIVRAVGPIPSGRAPRGARGLKPREGAPVEEAVARGLNLSVSAKRVPAGRQARHHRGLPRELYLLKSKLFNNFS